MVLLFCFVFYGGNNVNNFELKSFELLPMYVSILDCIKNGKLSLRKLLAPLHTIETLGYHKGQ